MSSVSVDALDSVRRSESIEASPARPLEGVLEGSLDPVLRRELARDGVSAARALLGAVLTSTRDGQTTWGRIVEVEAYIGPQDPASHAAARIGRTERNRPMFGPAGSVYVYRIYGLHRCFNVVTGPEGLPAAVLVRALEPIEGLDTMAARRGRDDNLCSGPGRLAAALGIDESLNGHDLGEAPLQLRAGRKIAEPDIGVSGRVGVSRAAHWPLRYYVKGNRHVSPVRSPRARRSADFRAAISALQRPPFVEQR